MNKKKILALTEILKKIDSEGSTGLTMMKIQNSFQKYMNQNPEHKKILKYQFVEGDYGLYSENLWFDIQELRKKRIINYNGYHFSFT